MLNTGLRLSEATVLRWRESNRNTGKVMVRQGKGGKDRTLWVGEGDLGLLCCWRERQAKAVPGSPWHVFTTLAGKPVSNRYVQEMVKRCATKAGIEKDVHPHILRHTFAIDLYQQTTSIRLTQKALGWAINNEKGYAEAYKDVIHEDAIKVGGATKAPDYAIRIGVPHQLQSGWKDHDNG